MIHERLRGDRRFELVFFPAKNDSEEIVCFQSSAEQLVEETTEDTSGSECELWRSMNFALQMFLHRNSTSKRGYTSLVRSA